MTGIEIFLVFVEMILEFHFILEVNLTIHQRQVKMTIMSVLYISGLNSVILLATLWIPITIPD